jgi:hypothetical protein
MAIKTKKTWLTVIFTEGKESVELTINYQKKTFSVSHGNNDQNVTYKGDVGELVPSYVRHKLVLAALDYANKELSK